MDKWNSELEELLEREEILWKQQGKALWLREGDRNTGFFHRQAAKRFRRKMIRSLKDDEGRIYVSDREIQVLVVNHFTDLF
ncbi:UNVERIFIED_CONTAM: hypothetical protein Slati_2126000 [Sesamum latifolium]|uniref:Uncharacterized protein n=1 Tax=Sesamum latifolium TaxID=2727402 RepID=A0AAW2WRK6_9LAMI